MRRVWIEAMRIKRRPLWQPIAAIYALAIFSSAAGLKFGALMFGWSFGTGC